MAVAFDAKVSDPEHLPYSILEHPVKNIRDLSSLDLDRLTIQRDPTAKKCYEACCILQDQLGREVGCGMNFPGPFTCASALAGTTQLLKSLITQPEAVHRLLEFTTAGLLQLAKPFIAQGVGISVADPVASGTFYQNSAFRPLPCLIVSSLLLVARRWAPAASAYTFAAIRLVFWRKWRRAATPALALIMW